MTHKYYAIVILAVFYLMSIDSKYMQDYLNHNNSEYKRPYENVLTLCEYKCPDENDALEYWFKVIEIRYDTLFIAFHDGIGAYLYFESTNDKAGISVMTLNYDDTLFIINYGIICNVHCRPCMRSSVKQKRSRWTYQ